MLTRHAPARAGFTLIETLITIAVIGLLAAVVAPGVMGRLTQGQAAAMLGQMDALSGSLLAYRQDINRYPLTLRQLAVAPAAGDRDSCNRLMASGVTAGWAGPYVDRDVPTTGIPVGTSTVQNALERSPTGYSATGTLFVVVTGVDQAVAEDLEARVDGNANLAAGTVRWTATGAGQGTLRYGILARGC